MEAAINTNKLSAKESERKKVKTKTMRISLARTFRTIKADMKAITWPSAKQLFKSWGIVLAISGISGALIFGFDALGTFLSQILFF